MGLVVTTNSATLVNKGLEVIEAHLLFDVPYEAIEVTVHPQSIVHSMVEFTDGSTIAQASPPTCACRSRSASTGRTACPGPEFRLTGRRRARGPSSRSTRRCSRRSRLAKRVGVAGATYPAVFNAANEQAVLAFHAGRIGYLDILDTVEAVVDAHEPLSMTLEHVLEAERWARAAADARLDRS